MYVPFVLAPGAPSLVVRTTLGVEELASVAQSTVAGSRVVRMNEQVAGSMLPQGVAAVILAALALLVWASGVLSVYHSSQSWPSPAVAAIVGSLVGASAVWWMAPALSDALYRTTIRGAYFFWAVVLLAGGSSLAAAFLPRKPRRALTETP